MGLVKLLREVKSVWNNRQNVGMGEIQSGMTTEDSRGKQKLVNGKCVKPDEMDIKVVVKYAHEKLDPKHIQDQILIVCHSIYWWLVSWNWLHALKLH